MNKKMKNGSFFRFKKVQASIYRVQNWFWDIQDMHNGEAEGHEPTFFIRSMDL